jgi:MFS family permease
MILPTDLFPKRALGTVAGLVGLGGAMGGVVLGQLAGYLLDHGFSYTPRIGHRRLAARDRIRGDSHVRPFVGTVADQVDEDAEEPHAKALKAAKFKWFLSFASLADFA